MLQKLKHMFGGPQVWLTTGSVLIACSFVVGYHQDQLLADAALAERIDLPRPVAIQAFSLEKNTNALEEFQLLAEVNLGDAAVRRIGESDMHETYLLIPAYPLSAGGRHKANARLHNADDARALLHRPVARPKGPRQPVSVAILVYDVSATASAPLNFDTIGLRSLGAGFDGDIVLLAGTMFDRAMWQDALTGTAFDAAIADFTGEDAGDLPLIAPYRYGNAGGVGGLDLSRLREVYLVFGMLFLLCGGGIFLARHVRGPQRYFRKSTVRSVRKPSIQPFTLFQPIVSQEELIDGDRRAPLSRHIPRIVTRAVTAIAGGADDSVKSRL